MEPHTQTSPTGLPIIQGIELVGTHQLPDRLRSIFSFPLFNAVQSKCFKTVYKGDDNFVLAAPTGSGKTAVLELAICRLASQCRDQQFKVVYQAPTKSLCAERQKDWQTKFNHLGLKCAELTGDTEHSQLRHVQTADILVTTPEKWDSMTRKWKDHRKLMELVKLFLIDEVHILKEDRGASLEAVVSRMKSVGSNVRFVALSATVPNSEDIALWLGRNNRIPGLAAAREVFGEEFRPVKLQKHVFGIQANGRNDFAFDQICNKHLPEVISNYSTERKPIMVFCMTRKSTEVTAKLLAQWWTECRPQERFWKGSNKQWPVRDEGLRDCMNASVAFHHAGLEPNDRMAVEQGYLSGDINVICCTSTLAVGVNLPCHCVIIKNTVSYQVEGCKEYSDLEVMQMLGRAGRPQFDQSAVSVIMTRQEKVNRYEKMVSGQQILESKLHLNLIEHLNAEIGLGTIFDLPSAKTWLKGTFLFVRFRKNPDHYLLSNEEFTSNVEEIVHRICTDNLDQLRQFSLINENPKIKSTEFGDAMARYYVQFETMKLFMGLQHKAKISEILSAIAQASEFKSIRFRSGEKQMFKDINTSPSIKFPIKVDLALGPHKVSLIIQATLGGLDMRSDNRFANNSQQFLADTAIIFQHIHRLIRCVIDCQIHLADSVAVRNALELSRSFGGRAWDDSPLQMMQIEKVGPVAVRKFIGAGIRTVEELEETDSQKINMILSRNPPFGSNLLRDLKAFPKLRVSLKMIGQPSKRESRSVHIDVKVELGFLNDISPLHFRKKPVHVILFAETSGGHLVHFCKISAQKFGSDQQVVFGVDLEDPQQLISCYVSCDDIAGTQKYATLNPVIPASAFPTSRWSNVARPAIQSRQPNGISCPKSGTARSEEYGSDGLDDSDLFAAANTEFEDIDQVDLKCSKILKAPHSNGNKSKATQENESAEMWQPTKLTNGNWACNHPCKDKTNCKHLCCREGLERPPKRPKESKSKTVKPGNLESPKGFVDSFFPIAKRSVEKTEPPRVKTPSNISKRRSSPLLDGQICRVRNSDPPTLLQPDSDSLDSFDGFLEPSVPSFRSNIISSIPGSGLHALSNKQKDFVIESSTTTNSSNRPEKIDLTQELSHAQRRIDDECDSVELEFSHRPTKKQKRDKVERVYREDKLADSMVSANPKTSTDTLKSTRRYGVQFGTSYSDEFDTSTNEDFPITQEELDSMPFDLPPQEQDSGAYEDTPATMQRKFASPSHEVICPPQNAPFGYGPIHTGIQTVDLNNLMGATPFVSVESRFEESHDHNREVASQTTNTEVLSEFFSVQGNDGAPQSRSLNDRLEGVIRDPRTITTQAAEPVVGTGGESNAEKNPRLEEVDEWLLEQFGDIVEFV